MRNARKGDHEERAEDAPAGRHSYSGSIKRVDKVNEVLKMSDSIRFCQNMNNRKLKQFIVFDVLEFFIYETTRLLQVRPERAKAFGLTGRLFGFTFSPGCCPGL